MDASTIPRWGLPLTPPRPRVSSSGSRRGTSEDWPPPPAGDGRPVMLIPGFMAGDGSLTRMAVWLRTGGFVLARSGIRWNSGCLEPTVEAVERRLERAVKRTGKRALIVGQSRGGCIGRALAVLRPDLVETLVTLGSPLSDQLAVRPRVWPSILTVGALGTLGVPGMFSVRCLRGDCCARSREAMTAPFPTTSSSSRSTRAATRSCAGRRAWIRRRSRWRLTSATSAWAWRAGCGSQSPTSSAAPSQRPSETGAGSATGREDRIVGVASHRRRGGRCTVEAQPEEGGRPG